MQINIHIFLANTSNNSGHFEENILLLNIDKPKHGQCQNITHKTQWLIYIAFKFLFRRVNHLNHSKIEIFPQHVIFRIRIPQKYVFAYMLCWIISGMNINLKQDRIASILSIR